MVKLTKYGSMDIINDKDMTKVNSIATGGYLKVHDTNDR